MSVIRTVSLSIAIAVSACGGGGSDGGITQPPPPAAPARVTIKSASVAANGSTDAVSVSLTNSGGAGTFYLEFWGEPIRNTPTGCRVEPGQTSCPHPAQQTIGLSQNVIVSAGYSESLVYNIPPNVSSVKVQTQPVNTAVYSQTDCAKVRDYGTCP